MAGLNIGDYLVDFTLPGSDGQTYTPHSALLDAKALVIVFTSNHCSYTQAWEGRINALARNYAVQDVHVLAIHVGDSTKYPEDTMEHMARQAIADNFAFPYLLDETHIVADSYGAAYTPELFIFDAGGQLRYHGAFDDNYENEQAVQQHYAREALDAMIVDEPVKIPETKPVGCPIE